MLPSGYKAVNFFAVWGRNLDLGFGTKYICVLSTKLRMTFAEDNDSGILALHSAVTVFVSNPVPVTYLCLFCHQ